MLKSLANSSKIYPIFLKSWIYVRAILLVRSTKSFICRETTIFMFSGLSHAQLGGC